MIVFHRYFYVRKKRVPRGNSNQWNSDTLPDALTTALSGQITDMLKRFNREKLDQSNETTEKRTKNDEFFWKSKT